MKPFFVVVEKLRLSCSTIKSPNVNNHCYLIDHNVNKKHMDPDCDKNDNDHHVFTINIITIIIIVSLTFQLINT